jgi:hypothetical protein
MLIKRLQLLMGLLTVFVGGNPPLFGLGCLLQSGSTVFTVSGAHELEYT